MCNRLTVSVALLTPSDVRPRSTLEPTDETSIDPLEPLNSMRVQHTVVRQLTAVQLMVNVWWVEISPTALEV